MKCFFGELRKDGLPIDREAIRTMATAVPWYGEDGEGFWYSSHIGLGALQTYDTPESRYESAITSTSDNLHVLAGNYRIDNRDELIKELELVSPVGRPITDAEVILAAYAQWGEEYPKRLIGDFAFALWDDQRQVLLLVRDQIGIVPCYYYRANWGLLFSNDLHALMAHPASPRALNPAAVVHHLRDLYYVMPEATFWQDVSKLRPGHVLTASDDHQGAKAYWSPCEVAMVDLNDSAAYAARVRELLEKSIQDRLRTLHPVGTHLSGGLDSTAIAVLAQRYLTRLGGVLAGAYTWLPAQETKADENSPEYAALNKAELLLGMKAETVKLTIEALDREFHRNVALEGDSDLWVESLVREKAREKGIKCLLTGWGGDQIVSSGIHGYLAELFWSGKWGKLFNLLRCRFGSVGLLHSPMAYLKALKKRCFLFYHEVILASVPGWLYQQHARVSWPQFHDFNACILSKNLGVYLDAAPPCFDDQRRRSKRAEMEHKIANGELQARIEVWASQGAMNGIQYIYPLLDLRLVEFCLGVPSCYYVNNEGRSRGLFLAAVDDVNKVMSRVKGFEINRKVGEPLAGRRLLEILNQWAMRRIHGPFPQGKEVNHFKSLLRKKQILRLRDFVEANP